jgi:4-hydroxy-2-oxoglutarate aldolase
MPTSTANGLNAHRRSLNPGIFAPVPTFFAPQSQDLGQSLRQLSSFRSFELLFSFLDLNAFESHVLRIARAGVGLTIAGTMGEATHLTHPERVVLIKTARKALDNAHFTHVPIIAGTGAGSTRETVELCMEAARAGADYALVIASGYFAAVWGGNRSALKAFFKEVAESSPIPIILYNCASVRFFFLTF